MPKSLLFLAGLALAAGCSNSPTGTDNIADAGIALVPDFVESMAVQMDAGGIGAVNLPAELALSTEQQAAIAALHEAFKAKTAADVAALRDIEAQARAGIKAGKTRDELRPLLQTALPILLRLGVAFAELQADVRAVYTPEQRAWIDAHRPLPCGPQGPPQLTDRQIAQIRALQEAFMAQVKDDIALIRRVAAEAQQAAQGGAARERIQNILHQADAARERVQQAERRLAAAMDGILTPEQKAGRCFVPGRP